MQAMEACIALPEVQRCGTGQFGRNNARFRFGVRVKIGVRVTG